MSEQHTPGPWGVYDYPEYKGPKTRFQIRANHPRMDGAIIAVNSTYGEHVGACYLSEKEIKANAAIIAAAPDLLAALEGLVEQCAMVHKHWGDGANGKESDAAQAAGRAAIAKARGES